jgi:TetR/AcrR family transcriptional repressor of nem operon
VRYPAEHKQQTRERIVAAAARRFRSRGRDGAAIADLMRDLRLTHGGFYRHFDSKEDLFAEAIGRAFEQVADRLVAAAEKAPPGDELKALIDTYLSAQHCADVANGCPVAALVSEIARHQDGPYSAFQQAARRHIEKLARFLPGATPQERKRKTAMLFSGMAGTLGMARAMTDPRRRLRLLEDARKFYLNAVR